MAGKKGRSGRRPGAKALPMPRVCKYCGSPVGPRRSYCNNNHKQAAYRLRKKELLGLVPA